MNEDVTDLLIFALVMTSVFSFFGGIAITYSHMKKEYLKYLSYYENWRPR
jgi:hypothetical protein